MAKITAPTEGFTGPGAYGLEFRDGEAETDDEQVIEQMKAAGFKVTGGKSSK